MRLRTRQVWFAPAILAVAWVFAWLDPETGIRRWLSLRDDLAAAHGRIAGLEQGIDALETEAGRLEADPLAIEAAIREDLGLARSGDTVVILRDRAEGTVLGQP
ncbi:MAG: septum formation initiator family protein [bacterium]|nr:septum formation initiator family protein [bacterium]MCP5069915.1 septum formation initiator family protein [bacterium]